MDLIGVAIVAPVMAVRAGLRALLSDDSGIQVVGEVATPADLLGLQLDAEVVVWSPAPYLDSEMVLLELSRLPIAEAVALLLIGDDPGVIDRLPTIALKAWGVLNLEYSQAELLAAVHALNEGLVVANPIWLKQSLNKHGPAVSEDHELVDPLTERELEILQLLAHGLANKQIAARLKISAHTVKFHVSSIYAKMGTTNRVETVNLGLKLGLVVL